MLEPAMPVEEVGDPPARSSLLRRVLGGSDRDDVEEDGDGRAMWTPRVWVDRGVDPADGHRHSDPVSPYRPLSSWSSPGLAASLLSEPSRPIPPPSDEAG